MDEDNPWQVVSIEAFYCLKCPECMYFTTELSRLVEKKELNQEKKCTLALIFVESD